MQGTWIIERHIFASNQTYFVLADHCVLSDFGIPTSWVLVDSNDCCKYCVPLFYSSSTKNIILLTFQKAITEKIVIPFQSLSVKFHTYFEHKRTTRHCSGEYFNQAHFYGKRQQLELHWHFEIALQKNQFFSAKKRQMAQSFELFFQAVQCVLRGP